MYAVRGPRIGGFATVGVIGGGILLFFLAGFLIGQRGGDGIAMAGAAVLFGSLALAILSRPYLGIVVTMASLPLVDILPTLPFAASAISLLGAVTLLSYVLRGTQKHQASLSDFPKGLIWGILFVAWFLVSNPAAALLPAEGDRNWLFTFAQLWILAFLAARLLDTPRKHHVLIWAFSISTLISAAYAVHTGAIAESVQASVRGSGLAAGANTAARHFVVALVFLHYLRSMSRRFLVRFVLLAGIGIAIFGTLNTVSRTGILLLMGAIGIFFIQRLGENRQRQAGLVLAIALAVTWFLADNILLIIRSMLPAIVEGTDTIGDRYQFIESGFHMWLDNIIGGVGIGQYPQHLMLYVTSLLPPDRLQMGAHNMYIQVLAETGLVGLMLFVAMLASCVRSLWLTRRSPDTTNSSLAQTWLVVMVIMLLGGITKHDHYDKLIWLVMGISFVLPKHSDLPSRMTPGQEARSGRRFLRVHSLDG